MPAAVLVVGLDAAEATLIERWAGEGELPTLSALASRAASFRLENCLETLPAGIWSELTSGRSSARTGFYFYSGQIHSGEAGVRAVVPEEVDPTTYWSLASAAGLRVAAIDMTMTVRVPDFNGLQLLEWGTHDRVFRTESGPDDLLPYVRSRYGDHPVHSPGRTCDKHAKSTAAFTDLLDRLHDGVERKAALLGDLLGQEQWDLFTCAFGETHCAGHQFWQLWEDADAGAGDNDRLGYALRSVYKRVDSALGDLIRAAGPDATVVVVTSHGMGPVTGGPQLLPELLVRLGFGSGSGPLAQFRSRLPIGARSLVRRLLPRPALEPLRLAAASLPEPLTTPRTRAVAVENDRIGAIRLNLRGRDPNGTVEPGSHAAAIVEELREELLRLEHPSTGERIVSAVLDADEVFPPDRHANLPDILVRFRTDIGPIDACRSPRAGVLRVSVDAPHYLSRTGEHTPASRLWIAGPSVPGGGKHETANALDLAPTILALLNVEQPALLEGMSLVALERIPFLAERDGGIDLVL